MTPLSLEYVHWSKLKPSSDNPRKKLKETDPARYGHLKASLEARQFAPILVEKETLQILDGHQRWAVAKELDMELAVCYVADLTAKERKQIMVRANAHDGYWHIPNLAAFIVDLDLPSLSLDPITVDAIAPLDVAPIPPDEEQKWKTLKYKVPREAAERIQGIIASVCKNQHCKDGTALTYIVEVFAQDPDNIAQHE